MFTFVSKANNLSGGTWNQPAVFYKEDIVILLNQPEAIGVRIINSVFPVKRDSYALIAVKERIGPDGKPAKDEEGHGLYDDLNDDHHLLALGCLPYNIQGGSFEANP